MFSSACDMAVFLAANMGELSAHPDLQRAMAMTHRSVLAISPRNDPALAWEINRNDLAIVEKTGGLDNSSAYIALIPGRSIGIVILSNRGNQFPGEPGRRILLELAHRASHRG
jgi:beta-lactamase class C